MTEVLLRWPVDCVGSRPFGGGGSRYQDDPAEGEAGKIFSGFWAAPAMEDKEQLTISGMFTE